MANTLFLTGIQQVHNGTIDLDTDTLKVILTDSGYTPANTDDYVTASGAGAAEISVTGYVDGWGGAGRKTASITLSQATDKLVATMAELTWTSLATASPTHAILIKEGGADDSDSVLLAAWAITGTSNGNDAVLSESTIELSV